MGGSNDVLALLSKNIVRPPYPGHAPYPADSKRTSRFTSGAAFDASGPAELERRRFGGEGPAEVAVGAAGREGRRRDHLAVPRRGPRDVAHVVADELVAAAEELEERDAVAEVFETRDAARELDARHVVQHVGADEQVDRRIEALVLEVPERK